MNPLQKRLLPALCLCVILAGCSTVPITGRRSVNLVPRSQLHSMAVGQYGEFLQQNKVSNDVESTRMVKRVGLQLQNAVEKYFASKGMSSELSGYAWEFNLIESKEKNAWCMPGGKVVVYEGLLPITQDENGLAVVMGHEIAHAVARHGNERMSAGLLTELGGAALSTALQQQPETTRNLFMGAFGAGTQVGVLLPFSRQHESEADHLGLIFMALAGYDPRGAIPFWQRMASESGGSTPEFLSTHPASQTRINRIQELMPEALKYYRSAGGSVSAQ